MHFHRSLSISCQSCRINLKKKDKTLDTDKSSALILKYCSEHLFLTIIIAIEHEKLMGFMEEKVLFEFVFSFLIISFDSSL